MNNIIYKNYYIPNMYFILFYVELYNYYILSNSSARKFKDTSNYYIELSNLELNKKTSILQLNIKLDSNIKLYEKIIERKKYQYFKESYYENKGKIKIVGRGWKIVRYSYELIIKLGYSHLIFILLSPFLKNKLKKKKKKNIIFFMVYVIMKLVIY